LGDFGAKTAKIEVDVHLGADLHSETVPVGVFISLYGVSEVF